MGPSLGLLAMAGLWIKEMGEMLESPRKGDTCGDGAGGEAELSLGAAGGADPSGGVGECKKVNLGWTSPTLGNRHCRMSPILQLHVQGDTSVPLSLPP